MKTEIAYIDDNQSNLDCLEMVFKREFSVETFLSPELFMEKFPNSSYVSILVDIHMPNIDGFSLYEKIIGHSNYNGCPILFVSSDSSDNARIKSFELGAVDFIERSTGPNEMIARLKSKIKYFEKHRNIIEFGQLRINLTLLKSYVNGEELPLTFIELKILCLMLRNYPDFVPKVELIDHVWRSNQVLDATIYTHISNLNSKLKSWDHEVLSVKGKGVHLTRRENS